MLTIQAEKKQKISKLNVAGVTSLKKQIKHEIHTNNIRYGIFQENER